MDANPSGIKSIMEEKVQALLRGESNQIRDIADWLIPTIRKSTIRRICRMPQTYRDDLTSSTMLSMMEALYNLPKTIANADELIKYVVSTVNYRLTDTIQQNHLISVSRYKFKVEGVTIEMFPIVPTDDAASRLTKELGVGMEFFMEDKGEQSTASFASLCKALVLDQLDAKIIVHRANGSTMQEIADEVGLSLPGVQKRLNKIQKKANAIGKGNL
jgi:DNA-directed RNA polymerase specialized sigma subunit